MQSNWKFPKGILSCYFGDEMKKETNSGKKVLEETFQIYSKHLSPWQNMYKKAKQIQFLPVRRNLYWTQTSFLNYLESLDLGKYIFCEQIVLVRWWWLCRCWDTAMYPLLDGCSIIVDILHQPCHTSSYNIFRKCGILMQKDNTGNVKNMLRKCWIFIWAR